MRWSNINDKITRELNIIENNKKKYKKKEYKFKVDIISKLADKINYNDSIIRIKDDRNNIYNNISRKFKNDGEFKDKIYMKNKCDKPDISLEILKNSRCYFKNMSYQAKPKNIKFPKNYGNIDINSASDKEYHKIFY